MTKCPLLSVFLVSAVLLGSQLAACSAVTPGRKPASTATAIGAVNEQVEKGNIKIEGDTDPVPPP